MSGWHLQEGYIVFEQELGEVFRSEGRNASLARRHLLWQTLFTELSPRSYAHHHQSLVTAGHSIFKNQSSPLMSELAVSSTRRGVASGHPHIQVWPGYVATRRARRLVQLRQPSYSCLVPTIIGTQASMMFSSFSDTSITGCKIVLFQTESRSPRLVLFRRLLISGC